MTPRKKRRWTSRSRTIVDVGIRCQGIDGDNKVIWGKTRDMGFGGMFVTINDEKLPTYSDVDVVMLLSTPSGSKQEEYLKANVTRVTDDGVGLRFIHQDASTCRALQTVLL